MTMKAVLIKIGLLGFSFLLTNTAYSQIGDDDWPILQDGDTISVHPSLPQFLFKIQYDSIKSSSDGNEQWVTVISIYFKDAGQPRQVIRDTNDVHEPPKVIDINFDGYQDIRVYKRPLGEVLQSRFYTFNPSKMMFENNREFEVLYDCTIDKDHNQIESIIEYIPRGGRTETYRVDNGHLILIGTEEGNCDTFEKQTTVKGVLQVTSKSEGENIDPDYEPRKRIITDYAWILDSLRISSRVWKTDLGLDKWTEKQDANGLINCSPCACYILTKKEIYHYRKLRNGRIELSIKNYKTVNDEWVFVSTQKFIQ